MIRRIAPSLLCIALLGANAPTVFEAPAGDKPAGQSATSHYNAILPSGRIIAPVGKSVVVGMNALGVAISPDGRYVIVSNDDERDTAARNAIDSRILGGYSLSVVDARTMRVVDVYAPVSGEKFFVGLAAVRDPNNRQKTLVLVSEGPSNAVKFFTLSASGHLAADPTALAKSATSDGNQWYPAGLTVSRDGRRAYYANNLANTVSAIDIAHRTLLSSAPVGFFPYGVAAVGNRLFVTDEGLMRYAPLPAPVAAPQYALPPADPQHASALSVVPLSRGGDVTASNVALPMDPPTDGLVNVGGAHPTAIAVSRNGRYAYVAMTNVDRIAVVSLGGAPRVIDGLQLRLFDKGPFGTQPNALALSKDGKVLYAALAGINAIAVIDARDPAHLHRIGLIPTGWYPTALALDPSGRYLYVANAKGYGQDQGFRGDLPFALAKDGHIEQVSLDSNDIWATLQRIDLHSLPLAQTTRSALRYLRTPSVPVDSAIVPPLRSLQASSVIKHVVFILEENKTYDSMLGDLTDAQHQPYGNGDPSLVSFGESITPNLHALAREFGLADNEYAEAEDSDAGHQFAAAGIASAYTEKTLLVKGGRSPKVNKNEDPEDYPRGGYIFNSLLQNGVSYRDYGDFIRLSGYDEGADDNPKVDDPNFAGVSDQSAATSGLGGLYSLAIPAPLSLKDHLDPNYPGWNLRIRDVRRAKEFMRDYGRLSAQNAAPQFAYVWLPADHGGRGADIPPLPEEVADGDRALGTIVEYLSHLPTWNSTAIFITPDDAQSTRDHVSEHRSFAIVVSPYAKRHYVGHHHISTVSILKTEEELLGLPALSLGDLLATDMSDFFDNTANLAAYKNIPVPAQTASAEGSRIAGLLEYTDQSGPDADARRSAALIELSRRADKLAAAKTSFGAAQYAAAQDLLYRAALRVVSRTEH